MHNIISFIFVSCMGRYQFMKTGKKKYRELPRTSLDSILDV